MFDLSSSQIPFGVDREHRLPDVIHRNIKKMNEPQISWLTHSKSITSKILFVIIINIENVQF